MFSVILDIILLKILEEVVWGLDPVGQVREGRWTRLHLGNADGNRITAIARSNFTIELEAFFSDL